MLKDGQNLPNMVEGPKKLSKTHPLVVCAIVAAMKYSASPVLKVSVNPKDGKYLPEMVEAVKKLDLLKMVEGVKMVTALSF